MRKFLLILIAGMCAFAANAQKTGRENGYEWVDMGTSVRWATCNVGASTPKTYGSHFAWGEIKPKTSYTKSNSTTRGMIMRDISGEAKYDAATANWGGKWRMPSLSELKELYRKCTWEWYGSGYKVTAANGNVIYLPASGFKSEDGWSNKGEKGGYWSSTPDESDEGWGMFIKSSSVEFEGDGRQYGESIRPVLDY